MMSLELSCNRLIGTNPDMFRGVLKIRVGWVLEAIRIYLQIFPDEIKRDATLESLSPYKLRTLLHRVLTVSDWADEKGDGSWKVVCVESRNISMFKARRSRRRPRS
ncbi:unnamed protein product [Leptidea sinapis]|uniref:Phosphorylase b kinase regulatory subunit n=1 Tax=Leptidea sinapis TaxID=189913 RepID=A0A5E4Q1S3_9NEOP|nr:unnamed protein product [Leptidea sinapis]